MYCFEMSEDAVFPSYQLVVDVLIRRVDRNNKKLTETNTGKYQPLGSFIYQYYDEFLEFEIFQKVVDASFGELSSVDLGIPQSLSLPQPPFLPRTLKSASQVLSCIMDDVAKVAKTHSDQYLVFSPAIHIPVLQDAPKPPRKGFSAISIEPDAFQLALYVNSKLAGTCSISEACYDFNLITRAILKVGEQSFSGRGFQMGGKFYFYSQIAGVLYQLPYEEDNGTIISVNCMGSSLPLQAIQAKEDATMLSFCNDQITFMLDLKDVSTISYRLYSVLYTSLNESRSGFLLCNSTAYQLIIPGEAPTNNTIYYAMNLKAGNVFQGDCIQVGLRGSIQPSY